MSSNNKKILFLIFSPLFTKGGHSKNFLNLIKHIEPEIKKNNFNAYIVSYNNTSGEKAGNIEIISKISYLSSYRIRILKRFFPSGNVLFQLLEYLLNFIKTAFIILRLRPNITYAYADKPLYLTFPLRKLLKFKLIHDMRGDILDEQKVQGASGRYISILSRIHSTALRSADLVFSVSDTYGAEIRSKVFPKYNYYDGENFKYDETSMLKKRLELKLEDRFVFVYTGNAMYYQFLEGTIHFFSQFFKKHNDSFIIIITEYDSEVFISLLNKYDIPEANYMIKSLPQKEISELQQVADIGFLLRENLSLNHHSFPTKFAEYLASGVPVLMTPYIYSIAPMVTQNCLGEVIEFKNDYSAEIDSLYAKYNNNLQIKRHCSQFAQAELMWQNKANHIFKIMNK